LNIHVGKLLKNMTKLIYAICSGLLFALGLVLSGMTQSAKVLGFLNLAGLQRGISWTAQPGYWDPSLALVMGGALCVTLLAFAWLARSMLAGKTPWAAPRFDLPTRRDIDAPLLVGAALFGVGWGLAGYCPGPAFALLLTGSADVLWFVAACAAGMAAAKLWTGRRAQSAE
jgi:uncharacterized protein